MSDNSNNVHFLGVAALTLPLNRPLLRWADNGKMQAANDTPLNEHYYIDRH